ncbi:MAG: phosphatidate cytidylyltransferase [Bacteroidales bacterium]
MKELLLRTITGILLIVIFIGSILLGPTPMLIIILVVYFLGTRELFRMKSIPLTFPAALLVASGALLLTGVHAWLSLGMNPIWLILPVLMWIAGYAWHSPRNPGPLVLFWIAIPLASFMATGWLPEGSWNSLLPVAVIVLVWIYDTFAYLTGSLIGKHPLTPRLSPGKTWEGLAGGILFTMLSGWVFYHFTDRLTPATWIVAGAITSLFAFAGDLFESHLKRKHEVKNTGKILPGHGGILDRFDSLLFAAPAMFLILLLHHLFT